MPQLVQGARIAYLALPLSIMACMLSSAAQQCHQAVMDNLIAHYERIVAWISHDKLPLLGLLPKS